MRSVNETIYIRVILFNDDDCHNDYSISSIRTTHLPSVLDKYSSSLKETLTDTTYYSAKNGISELLLTLTDKVFLPAFKEIRGVGGPEPEKGLLRFQYYQNNWVSFRQWTRSPATDDMGDVYYLPSDQFGNVLQTYQYSDNVAPCFAF